MDELVLKKAKSWGFPCQLSEDNQWHILPLKPQETWKLAQVDKRWVLSLKNIPQLYLASEEALAFLESRYRL
jgi:hypothetical protein